jgi:hypothetical protein
MSTTGKRLLTGRKQGYLLIWVNPKAWSFWIRIRIPSMHPDLGQPNQCVHFLRSDLQAYRKRWRYCLCQVVASCLGIRIRHTYEQRKECPFLPYNRRLRGSAS